VPNVVRESLHLWVGCIAGALEERTYRSKLLHTEFESPERIIPSSSVISNRSSALEEVGL